MKTLAVLALFLALFLALYVLSSASAASVPDRCRSAAFRPFAAAVWDANWQRGAPPTHTIHAAHRRIECAPPGNRRAMQRTWQRDRGRYYVRRRAMLWRTRVTPFPGGGRWWAIPYWHVLCESGGNYFVGYAGAYGLTAPAWNGYGGLAYAPDAGSATPREQDAVAHRLWAAAGDSAWTPFEGGCL
jgi:hypothetical protein